MSPGWTTWLLCRRSVQVRPPELDHPEVPQVCETRSVQVRPPDLDHPEVPQVCEPVATQIDHSWAVPVSQPQSLDLPKPHAMSSASRTSAHRSPSRFR